MITLRLPCGHTRRDRSHDRTSEPSPAQLQSLSSESIAQELVGLRPDIIVTVGVTATAAVQRETRTIPIIFANVADPVATGFVPGLNQPGGNITGFATLEATLGGKWLPGAPPTASMYVAYPA